MKSNYWELREKLFQESVIRVNATLRKHYARMIKEITNEMKALAAELDDNALLSDLYRYNRFYDLQNSMRDELQTLGNIEVKALEKELKHLYLTNSQLITTQIGDSKNVFIPTVNNEKIEMIVRRVWAPDGKTYSDRIWGDHMPHLQQVLENGLIDAVTTGKSTTKIAVMIADEFEKAYRVAERLVRTELSYIQNRSALDRYKSYGYKYYKFISVGDENVCEGICEELDGSIFSIDEATPGENLPPMHPNCRCGCIPVLM